MVAVVIAEAVAIVFLGLLVAGLLRSHADILRSLHDLGAGLEDEERATPPRGADAHAPAGVGAGTGTGHDVSGLMLDGSTAGVGVVGAATDTVLAFLSTTCMSCEPFWDAFAGSVELPPRTRLVVVVQEGDSKSRLRKLSSPDLLVLRSDSAWVDYDVPGSPHFGHIESGSGRISGEGTGENWQQVVDLLTHAGGQTEDWRDNAERIDRELLASGIGPGHPSLYASLDGPAELIDGR